MAEDTEKTPEEQSGGAQQPEQAQPAPEQAAALDANEVNDGKAFAVLSYVLNLIGLPFFAVPLIMRNNAFSLYHAKQCLIVWLLVVVSVALNVIPCLGQIICLAAYVFAIVLNIMGIINAANGVIKPLALIGKWGEDWFKGITKV